MPSQKHGDYSWVLPTRNLPTVQQMAIDLAILYDAMRIPQAASQVRQAIFKLRSELEQIAVDVAKAATITIKEEEVSSRVRPDTQGDGGKRLEDFVGVSEPLRSVPGSVGLNFMPLLDDNVPWWWTNEKGYSGLVGRVIHGFFYDAGFTGRSRPDPTRFREHPLFRAEGPQSGAVLDQKRKPSKLSKGMRPGMLIKNPIPARRFVERGGGKAATLWHAAVQAAETRFVVEIEAIGRRYGRPGGKKP